MLAIEPSVEATIAPRQEGNPFNESQNCRDKGPGKKKVQQSTQRVVQVEPVDPKATQKDSIQTRSHSVFAVMRSTSPWGRRIEEVEYIKRLSNPTVGADFCLRVYRRSARMAVFLGRLHRPFTHRVSFAFNMSDFFGGDILSQNRSAVPAPRSIISRQVGLQASLNVWAAYIPCSGFRPCAPNKDFQQGGEWRLSHGAHIPECAGSTPAPALLSSGDNPADVRALGPRRCSSAGVSGQPAPERSVTVGRRAYSCTGDVTCTHT